MEYKALTPPEWISHSSVYQINPRTFSVQGTIDAVTQKLPELAALGFGVMYLCPVFEEDDSEDRIYWSERQKKYETQNPKNPYRMNDYFRIDSEYGNMDDLRHFVAESHRLGMKVLLDLVYLHIGPNADILKTHPEFAKQDQDGKTVCGPWMFPYLDYNSEGLREYLWCNMVYYIAVLDVDGFRCDVGDGVPLDFWTEGRRRIQAVKPDAVLINEGRKWDWAVKGFDITYCFDWHETMYRIFTEGASACGLREVYEEIEKEAPRGIALIRDIDNHDTVTDWPARTETAAGHDGMEQIEVINYLIDGVPMIYCGNELADTAKLNMFANRFYMGSYEVTDRDTLVKTAAAARRMNLLQRLNAMKQNSGLLHNGVTIWAENSAPAQVVSFLRVTDTEKLLFVGNTARQEIHCQVMSEFIDDNAQCIMESGRKVQRNGDKFILPPHGYLVLYWGENRNEF